MKRKYEKPTATVIELSFDEHIAAASGGGIVSGCWTHAEGSDGCADGIGRISNTKA